MIKSMTGFASVTREHECATVGVTARSVNHRYLDTQLRLPSLLADQETDLRGRVQRWVARGRVELAVTVRSLGPAAVDVVLNESLVEALAAAVAGAEERGLARGGLTASDVLRFPQAVVVRERETDEATQASIKAAAREAVDETLRELDVMRTREGTYLRADLETRCAVLADLVVQLEAAGEAGRAGLIERLTARVGELREQLQLDPSVIAQEVVRFAARSDVHEELIRLRGHLDHWTVLSDSAEPCGRKLDFLLQEMNREINTLGAKVEGPDVSELIVGAKAELEKLREQVANVE
ncbi:MAG: YicC family protein [Acidobacteria bacterium]|nr:YicC family protein [Acidobacteriota bacterium]